MKPDADYEPKAYRCLRCNNILGVVVRNANRVRHLSVFGYAVIGATEPAYLSGPFLVTNMVCGSVRCLLCGCSRKWSSADYAFEELRERRQARTFGLEEGEMSKNIE